METSRIHSLDMLRGLAAVIVVVFHCLISLPAFHAAYYQGQYSNALVRILTESPLHTLWAGPEVVLLFFILSGYVLSLPYLKDSHISYKAYIIKRFFRLYVPYLAVMLIYMSVVTLLADYNNTESLSATFNARWDHPVTLKAAVSYVLMLGYDMGNVNGVIWSLIHEMRISVFFPLIILLVKRLDLTKALFFGLGTSLSLSILTGRWAVCVHDELAMTIVGSFSDTFYYGTFFVFGAVLAKYTKNIQAVLRPGRPVLKLLLVALSLALLNFRWIMGGWWASAERVLSIVRSGLAGEWTIALGGLILFAAVLSSPKLDKLFARGLPGLLGRMSYSLYLVHVLVIMLSARYLSSVLPMRAAVLLPVVLALPVAYLCYRFIERPAMNLGWRLAAWMTAHEKAYPSVSTAERQ